MALIEEWWISVEGPSGLTPAEVATIRDLVGASLDRQCRRLETALALLRGANDIHVTAWQ